MMYDRFSVPKLIQQVQSGDKFGNNSHCMTVVHLKNGTPYYVYRILLYSDEFTAWSHLFSHGSVSGVFLIPLGLYMMGWRTFCVILTLCLSPDGFSSNPGFNHIIGELKTAGTRVVPIIDTLKRKCVIFEEVIRNLAYYPQSAAVVSVLGHNSHAPCTYCSYSSLGLSIGSHYSFSTLMHQTCSAARGY